MDFRVCHVLRFTPHLRQNYSMHPLLVKPILCALVFFFEKEDSTDPISISSPNFFFFNRILIPIPFPSTSNASSISETNKEKKKKRRRVHDAVRFLTFSLWLCVDCRLSCLWWFFLVRCNQSPTIFFLMIHSDLAYKLSKSMALHTTLDSRVTTSFVPAVAAAWH